MAKVFRFCWPLQIEDYSLGLPTDFSTRIPCGSVIGAAVKCNQCFKVNRARVFGREKPIVYTEPNIWSPIWRALALSEESHYLFSSPIPRVTTTEHAQDCGQSVQHAAFNLASDWPSPYHSVAPDTLTKLSNEDLRPISSSQFLTFRYIYTGMIEG